MISWLRFVTCHNRFSLSDNYSACDESLHELDQVISLPYNNSHSDNSYKVVCYHN